jgi:hypothetical protein
VDLLIGIGYTSSIEAAESTIQSIIQADERIHADPAPMKSSQPWPRFVVRTSNSGH